MMELQKRIDILDLWDEMPVMCIDLIAVDFIISTKADEENLIQSKFSYIDLE